MPLPGNQPVDVQYCASCRIAGLPCSDHAPRPTINHVPSRPGPNVSDHEAAFAMLIAYERELQRWLERRGHKNVGGLQFHEGCTCVGEYVPPRQRSHSERERGRMSKTRRRRILERDMYTCQACGYQGASGEELQIDHMLPVSRGGTSHDANLQVLCAMCNQAKGNRTMGEWRAR